MTWIADRENDDHPLSPEPDMCGPLDLAACHEQFSVQCFNATWSLLDLTERTPEQEEEMLRLAMTSHYHWTQREDAEPPHLSVAAWLISRVFATLGQADNAARWATRAGQAFEREAAPPFYRAYIHEAQARAQSVAEHWPEVALHLKAARIAAEEIDDAETKEMLLDDLATISIAA